MASRNSPPPGFFNAWTNQLGGFLITQIMHEINRDPWISLEPEPNHLFQKTKKIFLDAGLNEQEHLQFRECKLKNLCLQNLWEMTKELNPNHPRFQPEPDEDTNSYEFDLAEPELVEPLVSREKLEAEIASWYARKKVQANKRTRQHYPQTTAGNNKLLSSKQSEFQASEYTSKSNHEINLQVSSCREEKNWRIIQNSELEGPELDTKQLCVEIESKLKSLGNSPESFESLHKSISNAQQKASRVHKKENANLPLRLANDSTLLIHNYALTSIGNKGRGKSSKFRKIKQTR